MFLSCYHANLIPLYQYTSLIYDILCFFFYVGAVVMYILLRRREAAVRWWHIVGFSVWNICALNSKEMAVSLPLLLIAYEVSYGGVRPLLAALRNKHGNKALLCVLASVLLTAAYLPGKLAGDHALASLPNYRVALTAESFARANASDVENIFYLPLDSVGTEHVLLVFACLCGLLVWRPRPHLLFAFAWAVITPLPIAAIGRGGGALLYLPLLGWGLLVASAAAEAAISIRPPAPRLGWYALMVAACLFYARITYIEKQSRMPLVRSGEEKTWAAISAFRGSGVSAGRGERVLLLGDPFAGWDMLFIARLWLRDPELDVTLDSKREPARAAGEDSPFDQVWRYADGRVFPVAVRSKAGSTAGAGAGARVAR